MADSVYYFHWGVVQISLANLLVVAVMVIVFLAAIAVQLPRSPEETHPTEDGAEHGHDAH
jgi:hypothetical protein